MSISKLTKSIDATKGKSFPPVHLWNPELCVGQEISINREGDWFYNKSLIKNKKLVNLFSTVLRKDEENYFLVTPTEKVPVKVDIAPYMITNFELLDDQILLDTNLDFSFDLNDINTTRLISYEDAHIPLVHVRSGIEGFFSRNCYYKLIDLALKKDIIKDNKLYVLSNNIKHLVGIIA